MKFISIILISIFLIGCNAYHYVSPPNYVPVNYEKGKILANVSYNYVQLGYTFSDHFSVFASGNHIFNDIGIFNDDTVPSGYRDKKSKFAELNLGFSYYKNLSSCFSFEIVSGIGKGTVSYNNYRQYLSDSHSVYDYSFSFNSKKITGFVQPSLSFRYEKWFDFSVFTRFNFNRYCDLNSNLNLGSGYYSLAAKSDMFFYDKKVAHLLFFEPGIQVRAGIENFKFIVQYSRATKLQLGLIQYRKNNLFFGFSATFDLLKSRNKPSS